MQPDVEKYGYIQHAYAKKERRKKQIPGCAAAAAGEHSGSEAASQFAAATSNVAVRFVSSCVTGSRLSLIIDDDEIRDLGGRPSIYAYLVVCHSSRAINNAFIFSSFILFLVSSRFCFHKTLLRCLCLATLIKTSFVL